MNLNFSQIYESWFATVKKYLQTINLHLKMIQAGPACQHWWRFACSECFRDWFCLLNLSIFIQTLRDGTLGGLLSAVIWTAETRSEHFSVYHACELVYVGKARPGVLLFYKHTHMWKHTLCLRHIHLCVCVCAEHAPLHAHVHKQYQ